MTEEELRENIRGYDWNFIRGQKSMSIDFIREFRNILEWDVIVWSQDLTEKQIEEFKDYIHNWYNVAINQNISKEFLSKWRDKFHA